MKNLFANIKVKKILKQTHIYIANYYIANYYFQKQHMKFFLLNYYFNCYRTFLGYVDNQVRCDQDIPVATVYTLPRIIKWKAFGFIKVFTLNGLYIREQLTKIVFLSFHTFCFTALEVNYIFPRSNLQRTFTQVFTHLGLLHSMN